MKARGVLILAAVLGVLCLAYWFQISREAQQVIEQFEAKQIYEISASEIDSIELHRIGEEAYAAERGADGRWQFTKPHAKIKANQIVWDRMARELAVLRNERTIGTNPDDLAQYGLEEPVLTFLATAGDEEIAIDFGDIEPTQTFRYGLLADGTLFLADNKKQYFELNRPLEDLRDRFLVDNREANILRFEFVRIFTEDDLAGKDLDVPAGTEAVPVILVRDDADSPWRLEEPVQAPADQAAVEALLKEIQFAVGRHYDDDPESLADYGLEPAAVRVTVVDDVSGKAQTLFFGHIDTSEDGGIYVKRAERPAVFTIDAHLVSLIPTSPTAFRAHQLLTRSATGLAALDYEGPAGNFRLERDEDDSWRVVEPAMSDANPNAISNFIARLKRTEVIEFIEGDTATLGLDDPEVRIRLTSADGTQGEILMRGNPDDPEDPYLITQDAGAPAAISAAQARGLMIAPNAFRSRNLLHFNREETAKISFRLEGTEYLLDKVHDIWVVRKPEGHVLKNQSDVTLMIEAMTPLDAERPASEEDAADQGESIPVLQAEVTLRDADGRPTVAGTLRVGGVSAGDSRYRLASVSGREGLWLIKPTVVEAFREAVRGIQPTTTTE